MSDDDVELPGMWERADFEGGVEEVRGPGPGSILDQIPTGISSTPFPGTVLTLEQLQAAIDEIRDAEYEIPDRTKARALQAQLPDDFWDTAPDDDRELMVVAIRTIDDVYLHPRQADAVNERLAQIIADAQTRAQATRSVGPLEVPRDRISYATAEFADKFQEGFEAERDPIPVPPHTFGPANPEARSPEEDQLLWEVEHAANRTERRRAERELAAEQRRLDARGL